MSVLLRTAVPALLMFSAFAAAAQQSPPAQRPLAPHTPAPTPDINRSDYPTTPLVIAAAGDVASPRAKVAPGAVKGGPAVAARRYAEGVELERLGDLRGAMIAYLEAGEAGHGLAQKKLGDIYGVGNAVLARDYETSLRWYDRARQQGIDIPRPLTYSAVPRYSAPAATARPPMKGEPAPATPAPAVAADAKPAAVPGASVKSAPQIASKPQEVLVQQTPAVMAQAPQKAGPPHPPQVVIADAKTSAPVQKAPEKQEVVAKNNEQQSKKSIEKQEVMNIPDKAGGDRAGKSLAEAAAPPAAVNLPIKVVPADSALARADASRRYADGVELERRGDLRGAMIAFLEAGEAGYGLAQKKLGDIYGAGNNIVVRDYEISLRWYDRARQQGVNIPRPFTFSGVRQ